jgi:glycosyltransferase involved in cell wall biosynthesis
MKPKISVVTITYNAEAALQRTLDSVLSQSYPYVEHLIIDGASTDGTLALVEQYREESTEQAASHEVVVQSEPDRGIYDAMNKGLQKATGDYVLFLNAGDTLPATDTLELAMDKAGDGVGVLYGNTDVVDGEGNFLYHRRLQPPERLSWRSFRQGMLVCHQAFYARTEIAREIPYDLQYRFSADVDWCIRVMKEAERRGLQLVNLHTVVANYLEEGATTKNHKASLRERYLVMQRHYGVVQTFLMHCWFVVRAVISC